MLKRVLLGGALLASLAFASSAQAGIVFDLIIPGTSGLGTGSSGATGVGRHSLAVTSNTVGTTIKLELWARVTGTDTIDDQDNGYTGDNFTNDGIQYVAAKVLRTGTLACNLNVDTSGIGTTPSPFNSSGFKPGTQTDLNGDTYMDVGSNNNADVNSGFIFSRAGSVAMGQYVDSSGATPGYLGNFKLWRGKVVLADNKGDANLDPSLWADPSNPLNVNVAAFLAAIDGVNLTPQQVTATFSGVVLHGNPIPEPGTLSLLALGALGLLARRHA